MPNPPSDPARNWICINRCAVFRAIGMPRRCPYCGTHELYPTDDDVKIVDSDSTIIQFERDPDEES